MHSRGITVWWYQEVERSVQSTFFAPGKIIIDWRWKTWGCFTKTQEHLFCKFHNVPLLEKRRLIEAFQDAVSYRKHRHQLLKHCVNLPEVLYDGIVLVEWSYDGLLLKEGKK